MEEGEMTRDERHEAQAEQGRQPEGGRGERGRGEKRRESGGRGEAGRGEGGRQEGGRAVSPVAVPGVLRATRAWLLPRPIRDGLEMALPEICDLTLTDGMLDLPEDPALALSRAILDDLSIALAAVDELEQLVRDSPTSTEEMAALLSIKSMGERLAPQLDLLRRLQTALRDDLEALRDSLGEAP